MKLFGFTTTRPAASIAILASFIFSNAFAVGALKSDTEASVSVSAVTAKYTTDLTKLGREGRLREDLTFEKGTISLVKALSEGGIRQRVVVDEDKAVQESIVEQAALRIAKNQVPKTLADRTILKVETAALFSNAKTSAEAAGALEVIVKDAIASKGRIILYLDELTNFVGTDAVDKTLFNGIAEGKLVIVGGSSAAAYGERIDSL